MDVAAAIGIGRKVAKVADRVIKYVKDDNSHFYGLDDDVTAVVAGEGASPWADGAGAVTTADGSLSVEATGPGRVILVAHPFDASLEVWNGPDVLPDTQYRSMLASLFHDLIWAHRKELAAAFGRDVPFVLDWGTDVLYHLWVHASGNALQRLEARLAWHVCRFSAPWYHPAKKLLGLRCAPWLLAAAMLWGCSAPPAWEVEALAGTNAVLRAMGQAGPVPPSTASEAPCGQATPVGEAQAQGPEWQRESPEGVAPAGPDAVDFSSLDWAYGGFRGGSAKLADGCRIGSLEVRADGLSYKWAAGGCERLGASSRTDYSQTLACLFCKIDGRWRGGKIDWISTSRTTRSFANISAGYNGWDKAAVSKADAFAFVIVDKEGRRRSNVAVQEGGAR